MYCKILVAAALCAVCLLPGQAFAQQGLDDILSGFDEPVRAEQAATDLDDTLAGFEEDTSEEVKTPNGPPETTDSSRLPAWLDISGSMALAASYNFAHQSPTAGQTDQRGTSRLKTSLDLTADIALPAKWQARIGGKTFYDAVYSLRGREKYTDQVLDDYEDEIELTEVYLQGALLANLDLKSGRQVVVWGKSDNIRITDVLNPLDNREPGLVDIRDLRLPATMTKLDYYSGDWNLSAILLHEIRFNKEPAFGNDFYPGTVAPAPEDKPSTSWDNQEFAMAANGIFSGWDLSFYAGRLWDDQSHLEETPSGSRRRHSRITMLGSAVNIAHDNFLFKGEAAYLDGLEYSIAVGKKKRLDLLVGAEYTGIKETVISLELANRHIFSFDELLKQAPVYERENEVQSVLRLSRDFMNDTLQCTLLFSTFGITGDDGAFQRFTTGYDWSDALTISAGFILYQDGDKKLFRNIGDNDRLFAELRYSF